MEAHEIRERLLRHCAHRLRDGAVAVTDAARAQEGWETEIWFFTATYANGQSEDLVLRIYPGAGRKESAENEGRILTALGAAGFPVPELLLVDTDPASFGGPYLIMERLPGPVLGHQHIDWAMEFLALFVRLHQLDWRPYVPNPADYERVPPAERAGRTAAGYRRWLAGKGREAMVAPWLDWLDQRSRTVVCPTVSMIHRDFHPFNILRRADGSLAVIDWGAGTLDDYRYDLSWTWLLVRAYDGPERAELLLRGYEAMAGAPAEDFDFFVAVAAGRRILDLVISLQEGAAAMGMRPGMEEEFRKNIGHARQIYQVLQETTGVRLPAVEAVLA